MNKRILTFCALVLNFAALADEPAAFGSQQGYYTELNVGANISNVDMFDRNFTSGASFGANVNGGYQFNDNFALEAGYSRFFGAKINALDVAVKGIIPMGADSRFNVFGKIGPGFFYAGPIGNPDNQLVTLFAGVGVGYRLTPNLELTAQAFGQTDIFLSVGMGTLGLKYNF